jgi:hypothetical protein
MMKTLRLIRPALFVCAGSLGTFATSALADPSILPFTSEAASRGVIFSVNTNQFGAFGYGVGLADLNNNGSLDIIAVGDVTGGIRLWENDGTGHFTDRSLNAILNPQIPTRRYSGVSAADYDNDGDLDLYLTAWGQPDVLLRNDGNWNFTNVTAQAGLGDPGAGCGVSWVDFDGDGWLDIYVSNRTGSFFSGSGHSWEDNRLYRNNGDGTFTDVAVEMGVDAPGMLSFQASFFDYNGDGRPDLYLANDKGHYSDGPMNCTNPSMLFRNDGTHFTNVSLETEALLCLDAMCVTVGDFNNDLSHDIYVTNTPSGNALLLGGPNGQFVEAAAQTGTEVNLWGWASQFLDADNNGHLELFVCNSTGLNSLLSHDGSFPCNDLAQLYGLAGGSDFTFCAAVGDLNNDGATDLVISSLSRPLVVMLNNEAATRDWLKVRVLSEHAFRDELNAKVYVTSNLGEFMREIIPHAGYKTQNDSTAHFGLGDDAVIHEVRVVWPSGTQAVYSDISPNQTLMAVSPCHADITGSGMVDLRDLSAILNSYGQTVPKMTAGDLNANGVIDFDDLTVLLALFGTSPCGN